MSVLLHVEALDARYGLAQVLFGVSLEVGRNGAGKSTTLKAIMGLVDAEAHALTFAGEDVLHRPPHVIARAGLGYVPEERRIFTDLTVAENLEVGRQPPRDGRSPWTPERLYSIFPNLAEMQDRRASQMSGGEQQMLTIARTLMGNPRAVLLDEPSEGLAPIIVEEMAEAVKRMKAEGIAVLLSEQNLYFASAVSDHAYVIETGHIRHTGPMAEVMGNRTVREEYLGV
jgi:branched-chain amino acid transport system ATP-binding protein